MPQPEALIAVNIAANLERLRNEIADACAGAQRQATDVALMAVSKMHPAEAILEAYAAGQRLFGENRVQEWQTKSESLARLDAGAATSLTKDLRAGRSLSPQGVANGVTETEVSAPHKFRMHLIGPLQSNKTSRAAELFDAIDTVDTFKTAQRLDNAIQGLAEATATRTAPVESLPIQLLPILIEVKLSPEATKHGVAPEALAELLASIAPLTHLRLAGLMTVPPWSEDPEVSRPYFQRLRRLRDDHLAQYPTLTGLSMGMSNDFRVAIEEGSTTIRLGTAIFGKRSPQP